MGRDKGAFYTGKYHNMFKKYGYLDEEINYRLQDCWDKLFNGDDDTKIYYPTSDNLGFVLDTGNVDVRTEGMSYGMMMCVQMDKKEEFDRIWRWTKKYMWHDSGVYEGYFAWSCNTDGTRRAQGPAPDGEEYFAMALFFASHRWGDGEEPLNYGEQAIQILKVCVHKGEEGLGNPIWEPKNKLIKFTPESSFSDPSYHLPHYYELFSLWANSDDTEFWSGAAKASREYLKKACHPITGLAPEYANYDGTPEVTREHQNFYSDSYRIASNIGLDYEWFRKDEWEVEEANKLQAFFVKIGGPQNYNKYTISGDALGKKALHPVGLLSTNAMASLAGNGENAKSCVELFWKTPIRTGVRRYYDNSLYFFSFLALSGNYRIW